MSNLRRFIPRYLYCLFWLLLGPSCVEAGGPDVDLNTAPSELETVFDWQQDRCAHDFIPDSPARAYRKNDGTLVLIAAHFRNSIFEGTSFKKLRPNCAVTTRGGENADPSEFNDRIWIQGLIPASDGKVVALISHDFSGNRHPGKCVHVVESRSPCWYGSILIGSGEESTFSFSLLPLTERIVAASSRVFDHSMTENRRGFFTTTNVVESEGYYYFFSWGEDKPFSGNCLFRTKISTPYGPWMALSNGSFSKKFANPYIKATEQLGQPCDRINGLPTSLRSVVRLKNKQLFVGVYALPGGIHYATSTDLIHWTESKLLFAGRPFDMRKQECDVFYGYPSLIDHDSDSKIFDTADSNVYLYLMRYDLTTCKRSFDRDLIRMKVRLN